LRAQRGQDRTAELSLANAELARAARLKDEFLAAMSHELRTPLNAVLGMSEALQEEIYGPVTQGQFNALGRIQESGRHLLSLINDILDLSRIEAGKLDLQLGQVDLDMVCQASLHFIKKDAQEKKLVVSSTVESGLNLYADEQRLKQMLVNLLSNAVKFTNPGGQIGLEVTKNPERQTVELTVWDTGIGIAAENMDQLFKPFVQLDSRLSRHYEGTGLGLTLVYRMAEMHRGSISVESAIGQGSRFTISLPAAMPAHLQNSHPHQPKPSMDTMNAPENTPLILLVEDNEANITPSPIT
jgi:signal transduction histidine kinase